MKKLTCITGLFLTLLFYQKSYAQVLNPNASSGGGYSGYDGAPTHQDLDFTTGFGTSGYQMALHDPNGDLDILTPTSGYMIGLNPVLYTGGDPTSIFVGGQIPVSGSYTLSNGRNVCVGYNTYTNFTGGYSNTLVGSWAGTSLINGHKNTYLGDSVGVSDQYGIYNTFIGYECGASTQGSVAHYPNGDYNTMCGYECGYENDTGYANNYYGKAAAYWNNGHENCMYGSHSGNGTVLYEVDSNVFMGNYSAYEMRSGDQNVIIGTNAGYQTGGTITYPSNYNVIIGGNGSPSNTGGTYNISLGFGSDVFGSRTNAVAIGADAEVVNDNKFILGNNMQAVGIGMSGLDPTNKLEISRFSQTSPDPCNTLTVTSTFSATPCGGSVPTGASGLQFRDLTNASTPYSNNPTSGFLTVDDAGNVVLMQSLSSTGSGLGNCGTPLSIPAGSSYDPTINLEQSPTNLHNFWIEGNSSTDYATNVYVGYNCSDYPYVPLAKLNVKEASGSNGTIGGYFENDDQGDCRNPVIGVKSIVPYTGSNSVMKVAGWFEAPKTLTECCPEGPVTNSQYAILVPQNGGVVSIGASVSPYIHCPFNNYLLYVWGSAWSYTSTWASDSTIKTNVTPISNGNNALSVIQKLNGVSFKYVDSLVRDSGMAGTHYGFVAQQVKRVLPNIVKTDGQGIEAVAYTEIIPWLTEAIKEEKQTNDSLRTTLDSLRGAFKNIQNCLNTLCSSSGDAPVHHSGSNGNSGDSNSSISNVQEVTLSGAMNAPLLYQNIPNPFTSGTKINYYLPLGTQGATIVFYDTYGNQIKTVPLSQTGNGTLNITPDNLSAGIYSYSLIVNNNVVDTKRMILQK